MKYIDVYGRELNTRLEMLVDKIKLGLSLDIYDVPYYRYGIQTSVPDNNSTISANAIKASINNLLSSSSEFNDCSIESVGSNSKGIIVNLKINNANYSVTL